MVARFHSFVFCLAVAATRTQMSHFCILISALIDPWVWLNYMLIAQSGIVGATENAHRNLAPPLSLRPTVCSGLFLCTHLYSSLFSPLLSAPIFPIKVGTKKRVT